MTAPTDFSFDFSYAPDELNQQGEYQPLRSGNYTSAFESATLVDGQGAATGGSRFEATFTDFENGKGEPVAGAGRRLTYGFWLTYPGRDDASGAQRALLAFAKALGFATENGEGKLSLPVASLDEYVETANGFSGTRLKTRVSSKKRVKNGEIALKDDGTPWIDEKIVRVEAL